MATLSIIDVGHGNSAVLEDSKGTILFDAGRGNALLHFLRQEKIRRLDFVLITHADRDHLEGLVGLLSSEEFQIGTIRVNPDAAKTSRLWNDLLYVINHGDQAGKWNFLLTLTTKDTGSIDCGLVHIEIVAPSQFLVGKGAGSTDNAGRPLDTNSISVVIRLTAEDKPIALLAGDIDAVGLENLLEDHGKLQAPILIFPHHGGAAGTPDLAEFTRKLCGAVQPEIVIFSIGRGEYGTPQPEVVHAVRGIVPKARVACTQLSRHCAEKCPEETPRHLLAAFARGKEKKKCCAGTFVVDIGDSWSLGPSHDSHLDFIGRNAETALCLRKSDSDPDQ